MGNAATRAAAPPPRPAVRSAAHSSSGLCEATARDIALAWSEQLQGCVRLETDAERASPSAVESFEWVTFVFNGSLAGGLTAVEDVGAAATAARAATLAWSALACCAGFSPTENPVFWKRVFSELSLPVYPKKGIVRLNDQPERVQRPIDDGVRLFRARGRTFPRVRLVPKNERLDECLRAFFEAAQAAPTETTLCEALRQLEPFVLPSRRRCRRIPVAVEGVPVEELLRISTDLDFRHGGDEEETPQLHLSSVFLDERDLLSQSEVHQLLAVTEAAVVVEKAGLVDAFLGFNGPGNLLSPSPSIGQHHHRRIRIHNLDLAGIARSTSRFAEVCSALPLSQTSRSMQLAVELGHLRQAMDQWGAVHWAWLGYALFAPSPDPNTSLPSFEKLELDLYRVPVSKVEVLGAMAAGNNLLVAMGQGSTRGSSYIHARVQTGAEVRSEPLANSELLHKVESECWMTACVGSTDVAALGAWICVVLPGKGLGWMRSHCVVELVALPPVPSRVLGLTLHCQRGTDGTTTLLALLAVVGHSLQYLHITDHTALAAAKVQAIMYHCPALVSLRIRHDGSVWSKQAVAAATSSRLEELELVVDPHLFTPPVLSPFNTPHLRDLKVLRLVTAQPHSFARNEKAFLAIVRAYPSLLHASWVYANGREPAWLFKTYEERTHDSRAHLRRLVRGLDDVTQGAMTLPCRLAFLSVVHRACVEDRPRWPQLSRFPQPIICAIFEFSTSRVARELFVLDE